MLNAPAGPAGTVLFMNKTRVLAAVLAICIATLVTPAGQGTDRESATNLATEQGTPVKVTYGQSIEAFTLAKIKCTKKQLLLTPKKCRKPAAQVVTVPVVPPVIPVPTVKSQPSAPGYTPVGNPGSYVIRQSEFGEPHWNYCKPFTYKINPAGMSDGFKADMNEALVRFAAASGIKFDYSGETNITPYQTPDW
jgi:hypothetical protein